ncbi:mucin-22 [Bicyclus anynana]|uniref:Mucin-22 n=1 Tax=Bicyclus anynana TaxID=110368 RepID=A0A6J1N365_BICAN|nr:mucin-22 [Bicyclus anynana]XP_023941329.2 mucin-22 [Bicyclus anynana]
MKMKIPVRRSCLTLIFLSAFVEAIRANENENSTAENRQGRVSGRIIKLYSGYKPDPVLCLEEGFKEDPVQCSVFYRCVKSSSGKFTVFKFQCGPGTVYDPETEVCNHPSSTKRSECGGLKLQAEQNNDNEINDIELNELPSPISTILPVYTSHVNNITSFKVPINSTPVSSGVFIPSMENGYLNSLTTSSTPYKIETVTKEVPDINYNLGPNPWTNHKNTTQEKIVTSTTIFPVLEKKQPCTSDGFMGDSENCKKFYRCVSNSRGGFIRYAFMCSEPTVWDDHMQSCNHPWAVRSSRCSRSGSNNENFTDKPPTQTSVHYGDRLSEYADRNIIDDSNKKEHPLNYGDRLNNKDESDLERDRVIYGSNLNQPTTPSKDKNLETTVRIEHLEDLNSNNYNLIQTTTAQSIYSTNRLDPDIGDENGVLQSTVSKKAFNCEHSGFMGDLQNCKKFYRCVDNGRGSFTKYEFTCSQGTVWDSKIEACNYAWAVKECGDKSLIQSSSVTADTLISTSTSANTVSSGSDNLEYGYTNQINEQHEPSSTVTVSPPVSLISTTVGSNQIGSETDCTVAGFNGDKNDCKKFYRCVDNGKGAFTKFEYKCGDGTLWDQNIEACNHAWAVKSCNTDLSNTNIHTMNTTTTLSTASLIESTTPEKLQDSNIYNEAYGPEKGETTTNPGKDSSTTKAPSQKNDCESSGFMGDTNDCKKFYRCVDNGQRGFIKYEFSCGDGTVWDPELEACNHAWTVKHCGTSMPIKGETTSSSVPTSYPSTIINDFGLTTSASVIQTTTTQKEISEYDSGYGQQHSMSTMKPDLETSTSKQTHSQTNHCTTSGFIGDVNDCNKFYRCVDNGNGGFIRHEFSCGEGTVWDPEIEACNHAWAVKNCGGSTPSKENILTSSSTHLNVVETNSDYSTQNYIDNENTTPYNNYQTTITPNGNDNNECLTSGFMADKNDCKKFYRCVDSGNGTYIKYVFSCGEGTLWDPLINACNHDWAVKDCKSSEDHITNVSVKPTSVPGSNEVVESHEDVNNNEETTKTPSTTAVLVTVTHSDNKCESSGFMSDKNDCRKFYRCVDNGDGGFIKHEFKCGDGTVWDTKIEACNHKWAVEKCGGSSNEIVETTTTTKATISTTLSDTSSSSSTLSATSTSTQPINDEQADDSHTTKTTTLASTSTSNNPKPVGTNVCKEEGYFGDSNDCKKFYRCVYESNGKYTKYDFTCGDGTIWDQDITTCNHPYDVKNPSCKSKPENSSPVTTVSTSTDSNETPSLSSNSNEPASTNGEEIPNNNETNSNYNNSTTENPNTNNYTCTKAGFYPDPNNCKKFYRCVDWENNGKKFSIYHFDCADGTIWDPALETCNHEDSVYPPRNCQSSQQQSEQTTTTTSKPSKTTTEYTTTSENTSTQSTTPSSTTGESTTQSSTTEESTTQSSTTQESTTQESTTQSSTTQSSTTQSSTTQESTTQESATQSSTTQESTTQESTTQSSTTQSSTTQESTTQESTTQSSTTQESTTQESTTQSSTTQESTTQSSTTEESTSQSSTTDEPTTQSTTTKEPPKESTTQQTTVGTSTTTDQSTQSTSQSTNEDTTTVESSTTTTQMTTSAPEQTSTTTEQSTSTTETSSESSTETSPDKKCPDTADDQSLYVCPTSFKRHPKYCNLFYQCTEDNESHELKIAVFTCPNNTIYDEGKIQCVEEKKSSKKCNGQISQRHRVKRLGAAYNDPFVVTKESMACRSTGHFPFEKHTECSPSLLKCELSKSGKLRGFVYRCPEGFVYWNISRRCEPLPKVRDCKRSSYKWNTRYDVPLERYNIALK